MLVLTCIILKHHYNLQEKQVFIKLNELPRAEQKTPPSDLPGQGCLLQGWISFSAYGQVPPHEAPRVTVRVRCCVPPLPQDLVQELHLVNELTAQFVLGHLRLRRLLHPSVWSNITSERNTKNQSSLRIIMIASMVSCANLQS